MTAADRARVAAGNAALAADRARVAADFAASIRAKEVRRLASGLADFLQAARVAQEEVVSCLLAARAQLAEGQRAASSVVYRAASAAAAVAAVAAIVAHSCCDVADSYIVSALRDDSSEDDTWRNLPSTTRAMPTTSKTVGDASPARGASLLALVLPESPSHLVAGGATWCAPG